MALGERAPHWALGSSDPFAAPNTANAQRKNHFTVFDAREAMFRAFTGMSKAGSKAIGVGGVEPSSAADKEAMRKAYWATTFRALGDVVHLIQDMAQPQHTRNDAHSGACNAVTQEVFTGHESAYEKRVDARALDNSLDYAGYPKVLFNDYASFFSTRHLDTFAARRGIADYSNREFLSVGTNIGSYRYSSPSNNRNDYGEIPIADNKGVVTTYLTRTVLDIRNPTFKSDEVKMAHESLFKAYLDPGDNFPVDPYEYAMNNDIHDAQADLLIPRAVAYSAGLIDYFFRGRLEITLPLEGVYSIVDHAVVNGINEGFTKIKLKLRNITPPINDGQIDYPQDMGPGKLYAVAKYRRNPCYQSDLSGEHTASGAIINGCSTQPNPTAYEEIALSAAVDVQSINKTDPQPVSFDFSTNPIPLNATNLYLQVVFRGQLGSETDAVVVATKDISEPTFFDVMNSTDYFITSDNLFEVNTDPWIVSGVGLAFNDSYYFVAQMNALAVATYARVAVLVDSSNATIPITIYDSIGGMLSRRLAAININQMDDAGNPQPTPFNRCSTGETLPTYRGTHTMGGRIWFGGSGDPDGQPMCPLIPTLNPFSVLEPIQFDKINFELD